MLLKERCRQRDVECWPAKKQAGCLRSQGRSQGNYGLAHSRMRHKHGFDFTEFDSEATHLDLIINAAEEFDVAVSKTAHHIARAIKASAGLSTKRIGDKASRCFPGLVQITGRHAGATDVQLAGHANRLRL